jgi:hypothetical protein
MWEGAAVGAFDLVVCRADVIVKLLHSMHDGAKERGSYKRPFLYVQGHLSLTLKRLRHNHCG